MAFGPNTLALAGRAFDMVVLHTFFTDETVERCVATVRRAAEEAGRDPAAVRIWSCYATVGDHLPEELQPQEDGRPAGHLPPGLRRPAWCAPTDGTRPCWTASGPTRSCRPCPGPSTAWPTPTSSAHIATLLPDEWLEPAATGSPARCAERVARQFDLGVDGVIMHGATPAELEPVVAAYRDIRPAGRFDGWPANPGRPRVAPAAAEPTG